MRARREERQARVYPFTSLLSGKGFICLYIREHADGLQPPERVLAVMLAPIAINSERFERSIVEMAMERTHNDQISFEIVDHLALIAKKNDGWCKELNLVSWNGQQPPKFDIREWSPDHTKMSRGITLFDPEMRKVCQAYMKFCNARVASEGRNNRNAAAEAGMRAGEEAAHAQSEEFASLNDETVTQGPAASEVTADAGADDFDEVPAAASAAAEEASGIAAAN